MSKFLTFVTKEELLKQDISPIIDVIILSRTLFGENNKNISENVQADIELEGKMSLSFEDNITDKREIFETPEAKLFFERLNKEYPYILYFLDNESILLVLACLCIHRVEKINNINLMPTLNMIKVGEFMLSSIDNTVAWIKITDHLQEFENRIDRFLKSLLEEDQLISE